MVSLHYSDGLVQLYQGDALEALDLLAEADVLVTDPPYGIGWRKHGGGQGAKFTRSHPGIANDSDTAARDAVLAAWGGDRPAAVFGSLYLGPPAGVRHVLVWEKPKDAGVIGSTIGYRRDVEAVYLLGTWPRRRPFSGSVIRSQIKQVGGRHSLAKATGHPHAKPVDLLAQLVDLAPGTVADPFAGAGSTLVAAKLAGRRAIGIELESGYCDTAAERLAAIVTDADRLDWAQRAVAGCEQLPLQLGYDADEAYAYYADPANGYAAPPPQTYEQPQLW